MTARDKADHVFLVESLTSKIGDVLVYRLLRLWHSRSVRRSCIDTASTVSYLRSTAFKESARVKTAYARFPAHHISMAVTVAKAMLSDTVWQMCQSSELDMRSIRETYR